MGGNGRTSILRTKVAGVNIESFGRLSIAMTLLIRFPQGKLVDQHRGKGRELAIASASLLTPVCVMAYVLAFWRLAADLGMARDGSSQGLFSHWQLWLMIAAGLQVTARNLYKRLDSQKG